MIRIVVTMTILLHGLSQDKRAPKSRGHLFQNSPSLSLPFTTVAEPPLHGVDASDQLFNQHPLTPGSLFENGDLPIRCLQIRTGLLALLATTIYPLVEGNEILINALDRCTNPFINCVHLKGNVSELRINLSEDLGLRVNDPSVLSRDPRDLRKAIQDSPKQGGVQND